MRRRVFEGLESSRRGGILFSLLAALIALNALAVVLESVADVRARFGSLLAAFETFSVAVFTLEYAARLWACTSDPRYAHPLRGRWRYATSSLAVVDLLAILPTYLTAFVALDLRVLRLLRLLRLLKLTRYSSSLQLLVDVVRERRRELSTAFVVVMVLLTLSSSVVYYAEHEAQPEKFSSIPASMWWAIATLTTVGYGDVTPVTPAGKLFGAITAVLGVGLFALPAGLLASGFSDALAARRLPVTTARAPAACPSCGASLATPGEHPAD